MICDQWQPLHPPRGGGQQLNGDGNVYFHQRNDFQMVDELQGSPMIATGGTHGSACWGWTTGNPTTLYLQHINIVDDTGYAERRRNPAFTP